MLTLDHSDHRRLVMATAISVIALPSLWLMSRNEETNAPNVATAGVELGDAADAGPNERAADVPDPMGAPGAAYLDGPRGTPNTNTIAIAIPGDDTAYVIGTATYRRDIGDPGSCYVRAANFGQEVVVRNLDNGRSVTCAARVTPLGGDADIVLHADAFVRLADLTDAPVPVEISW